MNSSLTLQPQRYVLNSAELKRPLVTSTREVKPFEGRVLNLKFDQETSRVFFFRSLATMINAGIPLSRALALVAQGEDDVQLKKVAQGISIAVDQGLPVSAALARYPRCFPRFQCALVRAGEQSGSLVRVLNHLADHEEARQTTERTVKKALTYPLFILATALALLMVAGLVFSNLESLFAGFGVALPLPARMLIGAGQLAAEPLALAGPGRPRLRFSKAAGRVVGAGRVRSGPGSILRRVARYRERSSRRRDRPFRPLPEPADAGRHPPHPGLEGGLRRQRRPDPFR